MSRNASWCSAIKARVRGYPIDGNSQQCDRAASRKPISIVLLPAACDAGTPHLGSRTRQRGFPRTGNHPTHWRSFQLTESTLNGPLRAVQPHNRKSLLYLELPMLDRPPKNLATSFREKNRAPALDAVAARTIISISVPKLVRPPVTADADDAFGVAARLPGCSDIPPSGNYLPRTLAFQGASASFFPEMRR